MKKTPLLVLLLAGFATRSLATSVLFETSTWPPPIGMFVSLDAVPFANGVVLSNFTFRLFNPSLPLPPLDGSQNYSFDAAAQMQVSLNSGASFSPAAVSATMAAKVLHSSDAGRTSFYDTEMLQLDFSNGTLPAGLLIRESPTQASIGQITESPGSNGYLISSFFDVFLEVSLDGGQSWVPGNTTVRLELRADPTSGPSDTVLTTLLPPPCCAYTNAGSFFGSYAGGIILQNTKLHYFNFSEAAPGTNGTHVYTSLPQMDFQYSANGGVSFSQGRAPVSLAMIARYRMNAGATEMYDTEMLSLNIQGGNLPPGVMIRESPTLASAGGITLTPSNGVYQIQSFFDLWTEMSVDGGQTWMPGADSSRVQLGCPAEENPFPSPNFLPGTGRHISLGQYWQLYDTQNIVIRNVILRSPTQSLPPPPPGGSQNQPFGAVADFQVSTNGGQTFSPGSAPATANVRVSSSINYAATRYFDMEMLQLDIAGGTLPVGVLIRESPSRASLGCLSERTTASDYRIYSFFDIFTEISLDGGANWSLSTGPGEIILAPLAADLRITKTASLASALVGQMTTYNITVTNPGPDNASGVVMTDLMPANFTLNSLSASQGSFFLASNAVICYLTNVAAGASASMAINATPDSPGWRTNSASVTANEADPNPDNNSASAVTAVQLPLLSISLIQGNVYVDWPAAAGGFRLLQRTNWLPRTLWEPITIPPVPIGDQWSVKFATPLDTRFFELTRP